jgi:hypothetical protein
MAVLALGMFMAFSSLAHNLCLMVPFVRLAIATPTPKNRGIVSSLQILM